MNLNTTNGTILFHPFIINTYNPHTIHIQTTYKHDTQLSTTYTYHELVFLCFDLFIYNYTANFILYKFKNLRNRIYDALTVDMTLRSI